jgi:ABC-type Mn2+/Zn2+ transport system permease subunit
MLAAVGLGVLEVVVGLAAARVWALAPGGSIVLTGVFVFALVAEIAGAFRRGSAPMPLGHPLGH